LQEVAHGALALIPVLPLPHLCLAKLPVAVQLLQHPLSAVRIRLLQLILGIIIVTIIIIDGVEVSLLLDGFNLLIALAFLDL
jgi:hypothetical protein